MTPPSLPRAMSAESKSLATTILLLAIALVLALLSGCTRSAEVSPSVVVTAASAHGSHTARVHLVRVSGCQYLVASSPEGIAVLHHGACDNRLHAIAVTPLNGPDTIRDVVMSAGAGIEKPVVPTLPALSSRFTSDLPIPAFTTDLSPAANLSLYESQYASAFAFHF